MKIANVVPAVVESVVEYVKDIATQPMVNSGRDSRRKADKLLAVLDLLALRDPTDLKTPSGCRRGHRLTVEGKPGRLQSVWPRVSATFCQLELSKRLGDADGWKPAETQRPRRSKIESIGRTH